MGRLQGIIPKRNTPGYVYILLGDDGLYKIGSTNNLPKRLWQISHYTGIGVKLFFSVHTDNMNKLERLLHKTFAYCRIYGEWFNLDQEDLSVAVQILRYGGDQ